MATGTLTDNQATFTLGHQNNEFVLSTANTFVTSNIQLNTRVTTAVLTTATATNTFDITIPNGTATVTLNFSVDSNGNVLVT